MLKEALVKKNILFFVSLPHIVKTQYVHILHFSIITELSSILHILRFYFVKQ